MTQPIIIYNTDTTKPVLTISDHGITITLPEIVYQFSQSRDYGLELQISNTDICISAPPHTVTIPLEQLETDAVRKLTGANQCPITRT